LPPAARRRSRDIVCGVLVVVVISLDIYLITSNQNPRRGWLLLIGVAGICVAAE